MPSFDVTGPDGKAYVIDGPEGSTREDALRMAPKLHAAGKLRLKEPEQPQQGAFSAAVGVGVDALNQVGAGLINTGIGAAGAPGDIREGVGKGLTQLGMPEGAAQVASKVAAGPLGAFAPTSSDIRGLTEKVTGKSPEPTSPLGEYARTFGEFLPAAFGGEGGLLLRIGRALFPAIFSETGGQVTKDTAYEMPTRLVGAMTPATLSLLWKTTPDRMVKAVDDLMAASTKKYNDPIVKDILIKPASAQLAAMDIAAELSAKGADMAPGGVAEGTTRALDHMLFKPDTRALFGGSPSKGGIPRTILTMDDMATVRARLREVAGDFRNEPGQKWAIEALGKVDDWIAGLKPPDLARGNIEKALPILADARGDWWAARSLEALGDKIYAGNLRAGSTYSGQNLDNIIRQNVRSILTNKKAVSRYTDQEVMMMEQIVNGTAPENLMRRVSKMLPRSGVMGMALHGGAYAAFGPLAPFVTAGTGEAAGRIERVLANKLVRDLQEEIVRRSPSGRTGYKLPEPQRPDFMTPAALGIDDILIRHGMEAAPRAAGGPASTGQPYMVGERGPELFVPDQSGTVVPNVQTAAMWEPPKTQIGRTLIPEGAGVSSGGGVSRPANQNINQAISPPLDLMERTWRNYASRMTPEEFLTSEALWGGAARLAEGTGMKFPEAFASMANNMFQRMGANRYMTPAMARAEIAKQRGIEGVPK